MQGGWSPLSLTGLVLLPVAPLPLDDQGGTLLLAAPTLPQGQWLGVSWGGVKNLTPPNTQRTCADHMAPRPVAPYLQQALAEKGGKQDAALLIVAVLHKILR